MAAMCTAPRFHGPIRKLVRSPCINRRLFAVRAIAPLWPSRRMGFSTNRSETRCSRINAIMRRGMGACGSRVVPELIHSGTVMTGWRGRDWAPRFSRFKRTMSFGMVINGWPPVQAETLWPRVSTELRGRDSVQMCWMCLVLACNGTAPRGWLAAQGRQIRLLTLRTGFHGLAWVFPRWTWL